MSGECLQDHWSSGHKIPSLSVPLAKVLFLDSVMDKNVSSDNTQICRNSLSAIYIEMSSEPVEMGSSCHHQKD